MKLLSLLGSTGSIGKNVLNVVRSFPDRFRIVGLSAGSNIKELAAQVLEFKPKCISVAEESSAVQLAEMLPAAYQARIFCGDVGNQKVATVSSAEMVVSAVVGAVGLLPTLAAIAGDTTLKQDLLKGKQVGSKNAKLHLDGYNFLPYLSGDVETAPRREFIYLEDSGMPVGIRVDDWKIVFAENRGQTMALWAEPFVTLRMFKIFNNQNHKNYFFALWPISWRCWHLFFLYLPFL